MSTSVNQVVHISWEDFDIQTKEKIKNLTTTQVEECLIKYFRVIERTRRGMAKHRGPGVVRKKKTDEQKSI